MHGSAKISDPGNDFEEHIVVKKILRYEILYESQGCVVKMCGNEILCIIPLRKWHELCADWIIDCRLNVI